MESLKSSHLKPMLKIQNKFPEIVLILFNITCILLLVFLILFRPETPKLVLWQTVMTQMKCHIMWHFIRVCLFFAKDKIKIQIKNIIITCEPSIYTMEHPDLTVCSCMENSIGLKRLNDCIEIFLHSCACTLYHCK